MGLAKGTRSWCPRTAYRLRWAQRLGWHSVVALRAYGAKTQTKVDAEDFEVFREMAQPTLGAEAGQVGARAPRNGGEEAGMMISRGRRAGTSAGHDGTRRTQRTT